MKLGPGPTLSEAMDAIARVGALVDQPKRNELAADLREVSAKLEERSRRGPRGLPWPTEAMRLKLAATVAEVGRGGRKALESKAMQGMSRLEETRFCLFIEALGGGPADGRGHLGAEALNADGPTFDRAAELWYGQAQPVTERERRELERWRGDSP